MNHSVEQTQTSRRAFLTEGIKSGVAIVLFGAIKGAASGDCLFPYGIGLYGQACYVGTTPKLLSLPPNQGNIQQQGFRFYLQGEINRSYRVEYSTDLTTWTPLGILTVPIDGSSTEIVDGEAGTVGRRFYRVVPL